MSASFKAIGDGRPLMITTEADKEKHLVKIHLSSPCLEIELKPLEVFEWCSMLMDKAKEAKYDKGL